LQQRWKHVVMDVDALRIWEKRRLPRRRTLCPD
jgi:hypothetical protein